MRVVRIRFVLCPFCRSWAFPCQSWSDFAQIGADFGQHWAAFSHNGPDVDQIWTKIYVIGWIWTTHVPSLAKFCPLGSNSDRTRPNLANFSQVWTGVDHIWAGIHQAQAEFGKLSQILCLMSRVETSKWGRPAPRGLKAQGVKAHARVLFAVPSRAQKTLGPAEVGSVQGRKQRACVRRTIS